MTISSKAFSPENGREHDAVVIHARLGAEDGDGIARRITRQNFLHGAASGHAVADNDQLFALMDAALGVHARKCSRGCETTQKPPRTEP
jgi:hypothetical protein